MFDIVAPTGQSSVRLNTARVISAGAYSGERASGSERRYCLAIIVPARTNNRFVIIMMQIVIIVLPCETNVRITDADG